MICGMTYYQICWYFLIYSFLGWCVEVVYHAITLGKVVNRGFLNGPVCPVYGFGMLAVCAMTNVIPMDDSGETAFLVLFAEGVVLATAVELIAGWLLYHLFHARWWDYSNKPFNIGGYICPEYSFLWGLGVVIVIKFVHPLVTEHSAGSVPTSYGWYILLVLYLAYLADLIVSVMTCAGLNKKLRDLDQVRASMRVLSNAMSEVLGESTIVTNQRVGEGKVQAALAKAEIRDRAESAVENSDSTFVKKTAAAAAEFSQRAEGAAETFQRKSQEASETAQQRREERQMAAEQRKAAAREAVQQKVQHQKQQAELHRETVQQKVQLQRQEAERRRAELEQRAAEIRASITEHPHFGAGRFLRAFPSAVHKDYQDLMDELKTEMESEGTAKTSDSDK